MNKRFPLTQVRGRYCDGCDVCLEIPAFFIQPGNENYGAFGLDIDCSQFKSKLKFVHIVRPKEIKENYRIIKNYNLGKETEEKIFYKNALELLGI